MFPWPNFSVRAYIKNKRGPFTDIIFNLFLKYILLIIVIFFIKELNIFFYWESLCWLMNWRHARWLFVFRFKYWILFLIHVISDYMKLLRSFLKMLEKQLPYIDYICFVSYHQYLLHLTEEFFCERSFGCMLRALNWTLYPAPNFIEYWIINTTPLHPTLSKAIVKFLRIKATKHYTTDYQQYIFSKNYSW